MNYNFSSCTKDASINEGGPGNEMSGFSLQIQTPKAAYVTRAIGSDAEFEIVNLEIFAFDGDNLVGTDFLAQGTDYTLSVAGNVTTVNFSKEWMSKVAGKDITFYAVANEENNVGIGNNMWTSLHCDPDVQTNYGSASKAPPTTKAEFEAAITNPLYVDDPGGDWEGKIMDWIFPYLLMSGQSEPVKLVGDATGKITLKRRVARFDIVNPMAAEGDGQIVIKDVEVFNTPRQGTVFASSPAFTPLRADACPGWSSGLYPANGPNRELQPRWSATPGGNGHSNGDYNAETNLAGEETWRIPSVFYTYPTMLSPEAGAENMNVYIKAEQNGKEQYYTPANDVEIKANYRYTFVLNPSTLTFAIEVADFDEGGEIETGIGRETQGMGISDYPVDGMEWGVNYSDYYDQWAIDCDGIYGEEVMDLEILTEFGSEAVFEPLFGFPLPAWANSSMLTKTTTVDNNLSYNGHKVTDTYKITIPVEAEAAPAPFLIKFKQTHGDEYCRMYVFDSSEIDITHVLPGVLGEDVVAKAMDEINNDADFWPLYLDFVTRLNFDSGDDTVTLSSLEGIEYLPNLEELYVYDIDPAVTSIDLTKNPKLNNVELKNGTNVESIKIASQAAEGDLYLDNLPALTRLDLSEWPGLENLRGISDCPNLKVLDLRKNHNMKLIDASGDFSSIETILFEGEYVKPIAFELGESSITSLDFSKTKMTISGMYAPQSDISSIKFPKIKGNVEFTNDVQFSESLITKLDLTNVKLRKDYAVELYKCPITDFAFDPSAGTGISYNLEGITHNVKLYLPDAIYEALRVAGKLNFDAIADEYDISFGYENDNNFTFHKYSDYRE